MSKYIELRKYVELAHGPKSILLQIMEGINELKSKSLSNDFRHGYDYAILDVKNIIVEALSEESK